MKILFDLRAYEYSLSRGIGRYIYCLVDHILKEFPEIEISILKVNRDERPIFNYNNDKIKYYFFDELENYNFDTKFDFYFIDNLHGDYNISNIHNFFSTNFNEKILKYSKRIVSIGYDIINILFYMKYRHPFKTFFQTNLYNICDYIFVISESTKNDFIKYLNIDESKMMNIYGGFDPKFNNLNLDDYDFKRRNNNIVFISVYEDIRKNVFRLIRGFSKAYHSDKIPKDSKLYLCGKVSEHFRGVVEKEILNNNLTKDNIVITGYISDEKLIELISNSKANILPSIYEGLGLSILESYACNTPSFASNTSSTKELVLEECSFDPYDEDDISNSIIKALTDEKLCNRSLIFGKKLLEEKCNWDIVSKKVVSKLYELSEEVVIDNAVFSNDIFLSAKYTNSHIFTYLEDKNSIINFNNLYIFRNNNNRFIPFEYYNKFQDKYLYKRKIFVLSSGDNVNILNYASKELDVDNSYLYFSELSYNFYSIFDYLGIDILNIKKLIKKYYFDIYNYIKDIDLPVEIISVLYKNNIYGFILIINLFNIKNIILNKKIETIFMDEINIYGRNQCYNFTII